MVQYQDFVFKGKELTLVNIADVHFGNLNCDVDMVEHVIKYIKDHDCVWIGGGDYSDAIVPNDKRFDYSTINPKFQTPQLQYREVQNWFKPIANKCLGLLDGNHDIIHWKKNVHNYVWEMCENLSVPYLTIDAYIRLHFEKMNTDFNIYEHHGWTGSRTAGSRVMRLADLYNVFPMLNLYIMNHVHALGLVEKKTSLYIGEDHQIHDKISHFLFGGSFLRGYQLNQTSYVEEKTYVPTTLGSPILHITPQSGKHGVNFKIVYEEIR